MSEDRALPGARRGGAAERLRGVFANAPIGMAVASPQGDLLAVNPALARLLGRSRRLLVGATLFDFTHPDDREAAVQACAQLRAKGGTSRHRCRLDHAGGRAMDVIVHASLVMGEQGEADHLVLHVEDVSERHAMELELVRRALSDDLTRLPNRPMLLDRLGQAVARRNRDRSDLALLFIDVDGFKRVNDDWGHAAGDAMLVALSRHLASSVRPGDTVSRFGGDEFVVLCENTGLDEAHAVTNRLATAAAIPLDVGRQRLAATVSIGMTVASGPRHVTPDALLRDADAAMYEAKRMGPGRQVTFDAELRARDRRRQTLEAQLRQALDREELILHYQPQVDLRADVVTALEALVRWRHPDRGLLAPREFIPVAERAGLIDAVGAWVVGAACAQAAQMADDRTVWINVSAQQLRPELAHHVTEALEATGLPPERFGLELTEGVLMRDRGVAHGQLATLRALGVRLAIGGFGSGCSSLESLAELPVDTVKVDRAFTARLGSGGRSGAVIAAVLGIARALRLAVVVEGVETTAQLAALRDLGVEHAQGYLLGPPRPFEGA